jgi:AcrR family transcriptional regulator
MPRAGLTRERIASTAMQLADKGGLSALTLRGLASELEVHVTSLYNHVPSLEAVLDDVAALLIAEARLPATTSSWDAWVRRFASSMRNVARRHPGAFEVLHRRPVQGPEAAVSFEAVLGAFHAAGFDHAESYSALKSIIHAVLGLVLEELAGQRDPTLRTDMSMLPRELFPNLHAVSAVASHTASWTYLVDVLVTGIAAMHARGSARLSTRRRARSR